MSDLYELRLDWHLRTTLPAALLAELRTHLGAGPAEEDDTELLLDGSGPALRIGGVLSGVVAPIPDGWALVARQEIHAEMLEDLRALLDRLAPHTAAPGVVGSLRFHEHETGDALEVRDGTVTGIDP
ncbi:hypothetical protein [Streptomyces sp. I05A-00742]|uniref:hypothetical protein n=1 Tax=Streptomyces sp. I05A-00742 TaxID=2732853 RepID=UPI001487A388|nr:hypothetical protein [Streptomyces sp. I05A-00742]